MPTETCAAGLVDVVCQGNPYQMGLIQGQGLRDKIRASRGALAELEAFRLEQPRWLPFAAFRHLAERRAARLMAQALAREHPEMHQRLTGIAAGSGVRLGPLYLLNALESFLSSVEGRTVRPGLGACSAVAVRGSRSATGEPMIARNFDYLPLVQPFYVLRDSRPQGRYRSLDFTVAPLAGSVDGLNEQGLAITYNYAFTVDMPSARTPITMAIAEAMGRCSTVAEAAELIASRARWGGGILMLADAGGDIASLELSNSRSHLRRPEPGNDALFHTNAFCCGPMRAVQAPTDAVFTSRAPLALRGRRVMESSEMRDCRLARLLERGEPLDPDQLARMMSDHGDEGVASGTTLCMHSDYWHTTASLQYFPKSRRMRVAFAPTCNARYRELSLELGT
jgi:hypothetical protein